MMQKQCKGNAGWPSKEEGQKSGGDRDNNPQGK